VARIDRSGCSACIAPSQSMAPCHRQEPTRRPLQ
jgi:hypothetical protein